MTNQPFNVEEWLNSKKKGISGKVPRADFIAKIKELALEIENKTQLLAQQETKNKELETKLSETQTNLKTSQTELTNRDQTIKEKNKEIESLKSNSEQLELKIDEYKENIKSLEVKNEEQYKTIEDLQNQIKTKEKELQTLQSRPDITEQKYQELLNSQEKHSEKDLKPTNLPDDWERQLEDKKELAEKNKEMEGQLKSVYHTYPIIMEEEKPENVKKYIGELSERIEKYKDYELIKTELEKVKKELQNKSSEIENSAKQTKEKGRTETEYQALNQQLQTEKEKNKVLEGKLSELPPSIVQKNEETQEIIKKIGELINPLKLEIIELKKQLVNNSLPESSSANSELLTDYEKLKNSKEELLKVLGILGSKL